MAMPPPSRLIVAGFRRSSRMQASACEVLARAVDDPALSEEILRAVSASISK